MIQRFGLLEVLGLAVHHPDFSVGHVGNLAACPLENAGEDGGLVFQQKRGESDGEDQAQVFGPVPGQHFEGNEIHIFE